MAYDEALADRIRHLIGPAPRLAEKKMFGGLAFLIGGHMAVAASGQGGLLVRANPDDSDKLVAAGADVMEMRGQAMTGWLRVKADNVTTDTVLAKWVQVGVDYASSLPPKPGSG